MEYISNDPELKKFYGEYNIIVDQAKHERNFCVDTTLLHDRLYGEGTRVIYGWRASRINATIVAYIRKDPELLNLSSEHIEWLEKLRFHPLEGHAAEQRSKEEVAK